MNAVSKVLGLIFSFFLLLSAQPAYAEDRSFEIGEVEIHARVDSDGNMHVIEMDTYHFQGTFNGIIVDLTTSGSDGIEHFQAFEVKGQQTIPLPFEQTGDGDKPQYKIYAPSTDETKVFQFTYSLKNVVQVYADTAELYWKFFDQTNPSTLGTVRIDVELPDGAEREKIAAFGHGPLDGFVGIEDNGVVQYQVSPLPSEELLEVRVLFPSSYVPGSTKISPDAKLDQIMEQERKWAADAETIEPSVYGALALLLANLAAGVIILVRFNKSFKSDWNGNYYRELPSDVTPAVVSYLVKYRAVPGDLMATLVDLVRKKRVTMKVVNAGNGRRSQSDYTFRLIDKRTDGLQPHETMLIDWFFGELGSAGKVSLSDIRRHGKANAADFQKRWSQWQDEVVQAIDRLGYIKHQGGMYGTIIVVVIVQFFGFWFLAPEDWRWLMFCALPLLFFKPKNKRRTKMGQTEYMKWMAFKRFLQDYSQIASREPLAVHLWEHYFVYAIPLDVAKKMIAITRLNISSANQDSMMFDGSLLYHYDTWTESFEKTISAANHSTSSSEDSGGSFSSGGGDGGGGGGRSAF